jgi:hypothetical protein
MMANSSKVISGTAKVTHPMQPLTESVAVSAISVIKTLQHHFSPQKITVIHHSFHA